jgi:hypothetical protein
MTASLVVEPMKKRPSGMVSAATMPMTSEPLTFTSSVPQGKVSPKALAMTPESQ